MTPQQAIEKHHPKMVGAFDFGTICQTIGKVREIVHRTTISHEYKSLTSGFMAAKFWAKKLYDYCGAPPPVIGYWYFDKDGYLMFGETLYSDPTDQSPAQVTDSQ